VAQHELGFALALRPGARIHGKYFHGFLLLKTDPLGISATYAVSIRRTGHQSSALFAYPLKNWLRQLSTKTGQFLKIKMGSSQSFRIVSFAETYAF